MKLLDPTTLLAELAQLESGVVHREIVLANIRRMVADAPEGVPMVLHALACQEVRSSSYCRCKHTGKCRVCVVLT